MVSAASWRKIGLRGMTGHNSYNVVIPIFFETVPVCNKKYFYLHNKMVYAFLINYAIQNNGSIQTTTAIVDTVIVESTAIVEQNPLTTQFYLLLVESPL